MLKAQETRRGLMIGTCSEVLNIRYTGLPSRDLRLMSPNLKPWVLEVSRKLTQPLAVNSCSVLDFAFGLFKMLHLWMHLRKSPQMYEGTEI